MRGSQLYIIITFVPGANFIQPRPSNMSDIRRHYEIETEIARKLSATTRSERLALYSWAYDELFKRVTDHPLIAPVSEGERAARIDKELANMGPLLKSGEVYLEIGCGDGDIAAAVAKRVKKVYALDVSSVITSRNAENENIELVITDGVSIPVPPNSVDFAYSNQLMEHLHPDDALEQLRNVFAALAPGGTYFCITPNRLSGPHDVSRQFDGVATGLHLKEYSISEMNEIFRRIGFVRIRLFLRYSSFSGFLPVWPFRFAEMVLDKLPHRIRKLTTFNRSVRFLLGVKIVGEKPR